GQGFSACGTRVLSGPAARAAAPRLLATVGSGGGITLTTAAGRRVRRLDAGTYRIVVRDRSPRHSFHLVGRGVDRATGTRFRGRRTWFVKLHGAGAYRFFSDAGPRRRSGSFRVVSRTVRKLWGNADGTFRTKGRYASATVRGTVWLTADRCEGTDVLVRAGSVTVRDFVREIDVVVRAGQRYLAQPGAEGAGLRCTIVGTPGPDVLRGTSRRDVLCGLGGDDVLLGLGAGDVLLGGDGNDRLVGGAGPDRLFGGCGNDLLLGGPGNDLLDDSEGRNVFRGGPGSDRCRGGGRVTACP
ncbi:MAG TPA: calcium-binding protein, partial [Longimicrobiales bacterium]|nr:calcium-binding protein [Longimicrobiales bacterium]